MTTLAKTFKWTLYLILPAVLTFWGCSSDDNDNNNPNNNAPANFNAPIGFDQPCTLQGCPPNDGDWRTPGPRNPLPQPDQGEALLAPAIGSNVNLSGYVSFELALSFYGLTNVEGGYLDGDRYTGPVAALGFLDVYEDGRVCGLPQGQYEIETQVPGQWFGFWRFGGLVLRAIDPNGGSFTLQLPQNYLFQPSSQWTSDGGDVFAHRLSQTVVFDLPCFVPSFQLE